MQSDISTLPRRRSSEWAFVAVCAVVVAAAGALRVAAGRDAFWVDEIMSWRFARAMPHALAVFYGIRSDNNHHLNTLWMYLIGDRWNWFWYRVPAIVLGTAAVGMAGV